MAQSDWRSKSTETSVLHGEERTSLATRIFVPGVRVENLTRTPVQCHGACSHHTRPAGHCTRPSRRTVAVLADVHRSPDVLHNVAKFFAYASLSRF